jgi:hypothetical protein
LPRAIKKNPSNSLVVCTIGFGGFGKDGVAFAIQRGTRLRGDNPHVRRHPDRFVPDGTPENEWPNEALYVEG